MDLSELNSVGRVEFLPTKKLAELTLNRAYSVSKLKQVQTKFGPRYLVELEGEFDMFLSKRISDHLLTHESLVIQLQDAVQHMRLQIIKRKNDDVEFVYV